MGEVYKGRDTRLDRHVAIKVLPPHLSSNPDFRLRFEREAKVISGFNHPNICTLHDIGKDGEVDFLVMELCDGETLADRLARGPLPLDQLLKYGSQIAEALDRAHRNGIVHRDLKPGNIMITKGGAKLLDFGLAKPNPLTAGGSGQWNSSIADGATQQKPLTAEGAIVGTFQYMAPEQLEGKDADARSDIFAFGAILYEMATGRRAFDGKTKASLIASILDRQPPPISEVQPLTPPALERTIRTALEKDPDDRWQTAHDLLLQLRWIAEAGSQAGVAAPVVARRRRREGLAWTLAALSLLGAVILGTMLLIRLREPKVTRWTSIAPPVDAIFQMDGDNAASLTISPDGKMITFAGVDGEGRTSIWLRSLDSPEARSIPGTHNGSYPFWSPDSRHIAFFAEGKLKRIDVRGGPPLTICDVQVNPRSGSWNRDDVIIFSPTSLSPVHRVSAAGGKPEPVTKLDEKTRESTHRWASFLPDQKHFLYMAGSHSAGTRSEQNAIFAGSLDGKTRKLIVHARSNVRYANGHLLYLRDGVLMAHPFDPDALALKGDPVPLIPAVQHQVSWFHGTFSVSEEGTLVYRTGLLDPRERAVWTDRAGTEIGVAADPANYFEVSIAPDGKRFASVIEDSSAGTSDVWIHDPQRKSGIRLTMDRNSEYSPVWSPDGSTIAFARDQNNSGVIFLKPTSGRGAEARLVDTPTNKTVTDWSEDGRFLAYDDYQPGKNGNVLIVPMTGDRKPFEFLASEFAEGSLRFSPDGRWAAYVSDETGRPEVFVTPFPEGGVKWQISEKGGIAVWWTNGGREIMFASGTDGLFAVEVSISGDDFQTGPPRLLFRDETATGGDASPDGQRLLLLRRPREATNAAVTLVTNWTNALKK
jgi:Tol biopolymer transport system component